MSISKRCILRTNFSLKKKDEKTRRVSKNEPKNTENDDDKKLYFLVVQDTGGNVGKFFFPVL